jgi:hypothetical protein
MGGVTEEFYLDALESETRAQCCGVRRARAWMRPVITTLSIHTFH